MEWWRWAALVTVLGLGVVLLLLWFDSLRDRKGWTSGQAARPPMIASIGLLPAALLVVVGPWWLVAALVAVPALAVLTMAMAS